MDQSSIMSAIKQICTEKGLSVEVVKQTIENALAAAYRKDVGNKMQNIKVDFDLETSNSRIYDVKTVVEDLPPEELEEESADVGKEKVITSEKKAEGSEEEEKRRFNPKTEIQLSEAKEIKKGAKIGDEIVTELEVPEGYGRMAAQTAKQVIIQKLREAERNKLFEEFKEKEGVIISGVVQKRDPRMVLIDMGKVTAVLPQEEQIRTEKYYPGDTVKVLIKSVRETIKGPEVIVSRADSELIRSLFTLEIPEIDSGIVEIKSVAREAGSRSKVAVMATQENIDPIGSCVGQRGTRIQTIISELGGEKIDIIEYDEDPAVFIANSLSPAKVISIEANEKEHTAKAIVAEDQFSLAIGKEGQNVRLAAKLTGWKINIIGDSGAVAAASVPEGEEKDAPADEDAGVKEQSEEITSEDGEEEVVEEKK